MSFKYIEFIVVAEKPKTKVWRCRNINEGEHLGLVKWSSGWRQYVFSPTEYTEFSAGCLNDIADFIKKQMDARKNK